MKQNWKQSIQTQMFEMIPHTNPLQIDPILLDCTDATEGNQSYQSAVNREAYYKTLTKNMGCQFILNEI